MGDELYKCVIVPNTQVYELKSTTWTVNFRRTRNHIFLISGRMGWKLFRAQMNRDRARDPRRKKYWAGQYRRLIARQPRA